MTIALSIVTILLTKAKMNYEANVCASKTVQGLVSHSEELRFAARSALVRIIEPLAGFVHDSGLSVQEIYAIFKEAVVRSAAERQSEVGNRVNVSGISASTGMSRSEVSKTLKLEVAFFFPGQTGSPCAICKRNNFRLVS